MWSCIELTACGLVIISNRTLLSHCANRETIQDSMGKIKERRNGEKKQTRSKRTTGDAREWLQCFGSCASRSFGSKIFRRTRHSRSSGRGHIPASCCFYPSPDSVQAHATRSRSRRPALVLPTMTCHQYHNDYTANSTT
jgi:hypothetical protein